MHLGHPNKTHAWERFGTQGIKSLLSCCLKRNRSSLCRVKFFREKQITTFRTSIMKAEVIG